MGVYRSASVSVNFDLEKSFESIIAKLINLKVDDDEENKLMLDEMVTGSPKHEAALKLQKVYKSFRTRRKLADCAVLIEQSWWKLLDFAELKHSSISFFDTDRHETAISRWSRARTRAAKVGKGLSKNGKAQKLALQHWLEAIDPRHRYGHNLHFYYVKWLNSQSKEPFFYWLDIGEGKDINLVEKCPRSKLQQQCIKYLGPMERKAYEVVIEGGKLIYKQTGQPLESSKGSKWIFVLSTSRKLYVGKKNKGTFQHSSFLAGGATLAAGRIVAENGVLKAVWPHSGHYKPTPENFQDFIAFLRENNVDLNDVKLDSTDEEEYGVYSRRSNASEDDSRGLSRELSGLEIPLLEKVMSENESQSKSRCDDDEEWNISERKKESKRSRSLPLPLPLPLQMGKQLSRKWSSGAGPRIGWLRDCLQEEVKLSPRSRSRSNNNAASCCRTTSFHSKTHSSPLHSLC